MGSDKNKMGVDIGRSICSGRAYKQFITGF